MDEVRRIRNERGLSQRRLAELAGVNKVTLVHIETGKSSPNVETLEKLAAALEVEVADFFPKPQAPLFPPDAEQRRAQDLGQDWSDRVHEILEYHEDALQASFGHANRLSTIGEEDLAREVRVKAIRTFKAAYVYVYASFDDGRRYFPDLDTPELEQAMAEWLRRVSEVEKQRTARRSAGGEVIELKEWRKSA